MLLCFRHSPKSFVYIGSLLTTVLCGGYCYYQLLFTEKENEQKFTDLPVATWKEERQDLNTAGVAPNARLLTTVHTAF